MDLPEVRTSEGEREPELEVSPAIPEMDELKVNSSRTEGCSWGVGCEVPSAGRPVGLPISTLDPLGVTTRVRIL
jgi:hypothetical protein